MILLAFWPAAEKEREKSIAFNEHRGNMRAKYEQKSKQLMEYKS